MQASDRQRADRLHLRIPMCLHVLKSSIPDQKIESINLSARDVFFTTDMLLHEGEVVELTLNMPEELTGKPATEWRCTGHVVYVQPSSSTSGALVVGVQFDCYEISRAVKTVPECGDEIRYWIPGVESG